MNKFSSLLLALLLVTASSAKAANQTVEKEEDVLSKVRVGYFGDLTGPGLTDPTSGKTPNRQGKPGPEVELYNSLSLGYQANTQTKLYLNPRFNYRPIDNQEVEAMNTRAGFSVVNWLQSGLFSLSAFYLVAELPTAPSAQKRHLFLSPRSYQEWNYRLTRRSPFTLGLITIEQFYAYQGRGNGEGSRFYVYAGPYVNYQILSPLAAKILLEMEATNGRGHKLDNWETSDETYIRTYLSWDATARLNLAPYVKIRATDMRADSSLLGIEITGALF